MGGMNKAAIMAAILGALSPLGSLRFERGRDLRQPVAHSGRHWRQRRLNRAAVPWKDRAPLAGIVPTVRTRSNGRRKV